VQSYQYPKAHTWTHCVRNKSPPCLPLPMNALPHLLLLPLPSKSPAPCNRADRAEARLVVWKPTRGVAPSYIAVMRTRKTNTTRAR
jgi:hypothetical protein